MTQKNASHSQILNEARLSGCGPEGDFGLSSEGGLSTHGLELSAGPGSSANSLCLMERIMSRGGVMLDGGRRYAAAAVLTTVVGLAIVPDAYAASFDIGAGETGTDLTITSNDYNPMNVFSGGVAINTTIDNGGSQYVYSNGIAISTTINNGGTQYVSSGGVASGTTVNNGGMQYIYNSGTANNTTVSDGGTLQVNSGDTVNMTGNNFIYDGGELK